MDSGAAVSVMPVKTCENYKVIPSRASMDGVHYRAAGGQKIPDLGTRTVMAELLGGTEARVSCSVAEVKKTLLSAARIVDRGHRICLGPNDEDNYIENLKSGDKIPVRRKSDVFVIKLKVKRPNKDQKADLLATVDHDKDVQRSGGPRQAHRL